MTSTFDLLTLNSCRTWRVTCSTLPPSMKTLRLSVLQLRVRGRCPKTGRCTRRDESVFLMIRCVLLTYHHSTFRQSAILCLYKFRSLCCCCTPVQVNVFIFSCYPYKFRGTNNIQNRQWPLTCLNVLLAAIQSKIANIIRVLR